MYANDRKTEMLLTSYYRALSMQGHSETPSNQALEGVRFTRIFSVSVFWCQIFYSHKYQTVDVAISNLSNAHIFLLVNKTHNWKFTPVKDLCSIELSQFDCSLEHHWRCSETVWKFGGFEVIQKFNVFS